MDAAERAAALGGEARDASGCERCGLATTRTRVVYGTGPLDAPLMLVGESPGFREDREGAPFAGRARELLERLLEGVGISLADVYAATIVECRPPGSRDPLPDEVSACEPYLYRQLELVRPRVVASLGSFATTLLAGRALGITRVHGLEHEVTIGARTLLLYPLYHPVAALYTPTMLEVLERDVARLPELLGTRAPTERPAANAAREPALSGARPVQLGLF